MGIDEMTSKAVFLDRDGTINRTRVVNRKPYPPTCLEDVEIIDGVRPALAKLKEAGFLIFVVTNQPDVARGNRTKESVEQIHNFLSKELPIDGIFVCYHDDKDNCACRKPLPGLLLEAAKCYSVDLSASYMIGDRWRDIAAGQIAGCKSIFIDYGFLEKRPDPPFITSSSLLESLQFIIG
jgi:D-glycero-D-manno-heptose 1,7-bisphosphate phosphatase